MAEVLGLAHELEHQVHVRDDRRDHGDPDASGGLLAHEVGQPAVVGAAAGDGVDGVALRAGRQPRTEG